VSGAVRKKVQSISGFLTDVDVDVSQRICIVIFCGLTKRMRMTISSTTLWLGYGRMIKSNCSDVDNEWLVSQRTASCLQTCLLFHDHDGWFKLSFRESEKCVETHTVV